MRAVLSVRPECSHRCVSLKETPLKPVQILKRTTKNSTEQTAMRTKWFKHIAIQMVQEHLLIESCMPHCGAHVCGHGLTRSRPHLHSGKKKQHKHKLFGPDFPRTFLTLTPERPWVKKFLPITGAAEKRTFWCGRPRFSARTSMTRRVLEKLCTKKVCIDFFAPIHVLNLRPCPPPRTGGSTKKIGQKNFGLNFRSLIAVCVH